MSSQKEDMRSPDHDVWSPFRSLSPNRKCFLNILSLCVCVFQYQAEIGVLQERLRLCVQQLEQCEARLHSQDDQAQQLLLQYQGRLEEAEHRLQRQQEDKELQMKSIISR